MSHHLSIQGNFTWDKLMLHNAYLNSGSSETAALDTKLESVQDNNSNVLANIFGTYEMPKFAKSSYWKRQILGGWKLNGDLKMANGNLISAPSNVNIIGPTGVSNRSYGPLHQHLLRRYDRRSRGGHRGLQQLIGHAGLPSAAVFYHPE